LIVSFHFSESHESIESFSPEQNDRLYERLEKIVEEHETLIDLCRKMSQSLATNVLIHYITSAIITCVCSLMVLLAEGPNKLIFVNYIIASTCQVFVYSIGGNLLADSSAAIQECAYSFPWYKCDKKICKLIHMMMVRAQKRAAVEVPFFQTSLETFGSVSEFAGFK
jgi:7tm Odorant receptor